MSGRERQSEMVGFRERSLRRGAIRPWKNQNSRKARAKVTVPPEVDG